MDFGHGVHRKMLTRIARAGQNVLMQCVKALDQSLQPAQVLQNKGSKKEFFITFVHFCTLLIHLCRY